MEAVHKAGIKVILAIQGALMPTLDQPMKLFSYMGEELFYMAVIPFLFWCVHSGLGARLLAFLVVNSYINMVFKWAFQGPRPHWYDSNVKGLYHETGYGVPSGHSQNALGVWVYLAYLMKKLLGMKWFWYVAPALAVLISFSRLYLGVHFPHDLVGGWTLAIIVLLVFIFIVPKFTDWFHEQSTGIQIAVSLVGSFALLGLAMLVRQSVLGIADPPAWEKNAAVWHPPKPGQTTIDPKNIKNAFSFCGVLAGLGVGWALMLKYARFREDGPWSRRLGRYVLGMIGLVGIQFGLAAVFPREGESLYHALRFMRYFMVALWAVWLAPWVFLKLKLAAPAAD